MAYQFNPFTGTFDIVGDGGTGTSIGKFESVVIADWVSELGFYTYLYGHMLNTANPVTTIFVSGELIIPHRVQVINNNFVKIYLTEAVDALIGIIKP